VAHLAKALDPRGPVAYKNLENSKNVSSIGNHLIS
jgi:hypothetical protein